MIILRVPNKGSASQPVLNSPCMSGAHKNSQKWENYTMLQRDIWGFSLAIFPTFLGRDVNMTTFTMGRL